MLILRDVISSETHSVPATGAVIGREGGDADIAVQDAKVSKRHARLYFSDGVWWIEDLQSANGTYIERQRILQPAEIGEGSSFRLAAHDFHVVQISSDRPRSKGDVRAAPTANDLPAFPEGETDGAARDIPSPTRLPASLGFDVADLGGSTHETDPEEMSEDETPQHWIGPAIAFHLANVPLLALNPVGTVRKSIEKQRFPALEKLPLLGLAAPGLAILLAVGVVFQMLGALVTLLAGGGFAAIGGLVMGIVIAVVGAAVGGAIIAFAFHPVFKFVIERLFKGESTMRSRTNFLVISQSVGILAAVPNGIAALTTVVAALVAPHLPRLAALLPIVPSIIVLACTLISVLLAYRWFQYFKVHRIVPILILVGGGLAMLGTLLGLAKALKGAIVGGGSAPIAMSRGAPPAAPGSVPAHSLAEPDEGAAATPEPGKPAATPSPAGPSAAAAGAAAVAAATAAKEDKLAEPAVKAPAEPPEPKGEPKPLPSKKPEKTEKPEPPEQKAEALSPSPAPSGEAPAPVHLSAYQRYAQKRDAVEHAITEDPLVLRRDANVAKGYKSFRAAVIKARKAESNKSGGDEVLLRHLIDADVFGTEAKVIDELYTRLHLSVPQP